MKRKKPIKRKDHQAYTIKQQRTISVTHSVLHSLSKMAHTLSKHNRITSTSLDNIYINKIKILSYFQIIWNNPNIVKAKFHSSPIKLEMVIKKIKNLMNEWQIQPEKQSPILQNSPLQNWNPYFQKNPSHITLQHQRKHNPKIQYAKVFKPIKLT